ncbi:RNA methyltransferase [Rothia sp. AR01]|uniref:RNA methyltransferase n=1 Tax=Rothia santali TaxID=2949643 RepID=A0A9X2HCM6_9MICC|nr:RNA methyltransferase [Rothia santali]MCP3425262.1 RNA methyltransferase [Rothia santali]
MSTYELLSRERTLINPTADRVKDVAALARPRQRAKRGLFLVEGPQALREALAAHAQSPILDALYVTEAALERDPALAGAVGAAAGSPAPVEGRRVFARLVSEEVLAAMSDALTPQGVLAVAHAASVLRADPWGREQAPRLVAAMVRVQDPGNAGTLIRAADAAGADAVFASSGSVDVLGPKAVRSTAGSCSTCPSASTCTSRRPCGGRRSGLQVLAADGHGDVDLDDLSDAAARADGPPPAEGVDLRRPTLWLFGNEARGLTGAEKSLADARVAVPVYGRAESLNVGTAATVCLYASARAQRTAR